MIKSELLQKLESESLTVVRTLVDGEDYIWNKDGSVDHEVVHNENRVSGTMTRKGDDIVVSHEDGSLYSFDTTELNVNDNIVSFVVLLGDTYGIVYTYELVS